MGVPILMNSTTVIIWIFLTTVLAFFAMLGLGLGGTVVKGRLPGDGAWYILYGAVTKFGYTKDIIGSIVRVKVGKSKLSFVVNPSHKTYLWGKPLYILNIEYGTSIHPTMWAILTALKELGKDDLIKRYLDLNYDYNVLLNNLQHIQDDKQREEAEQLLRALEQEIKTVEQEMRAFVDENAQVIEVKENMTLEELKSDKKVLVVRQLDPALIAEYGNGVDAPKQSANMDLYALSISSIFKSDVVKYAFAAMLLLIGVGIAYMLLHNQAAPPRVNIQISPELLKQLANETAKNATKVVKI